MLVMASKPRGNGEEREFQARMDLDTLNRASEIQDDAARMAAVKAIASKQVKQLAKHINGGNDKGQMNGKDKAPGKGVPSSARSKSSDKPAARKEKSARG